MKKTICALVASLTIGLAGCGVSSGTNYQTIKGTPISVDGEYAQYGGSLATVVDVEGKKVLGRVYGNSCHTVSEAVSLIQSEINDGDNEQIELTGQYNGNRFEINSLKANGYEIDF